MKIVISTDYLERTFGIKKAIDLIADVEKGIKRMRELCKRLKFPPEAIEEIISAKEKMPGDFSEQYKIYIGDASEAALEQIKEMGEAVGVAEYTAYMVFLLSCTPYAEEFYRKKNISEDIFYDTFLDLTYKLYECKNTYGIWGTFVPWWHQGFFKAERVALGRLQYEQVEFQYDYKGKLKKGDIVINCHIPSSGPLNPDEVLESLRAAYKFYNQKGEMYVMCSSWLLFPPYYNLLGKNTKAFYDLFDIFTTREIDFEFWRVFAKDNFSDIKESELKTGMQKNFYRYLKEGGKTGLGIGIITYKQS